MMRKTGSFLIILGSVCIAAAISLAVWNGFESRRAGISSEKILAQICIGAEKAGRPRNALREAPENIVPDPYDDEMTEKEIDGVDYVGYLSVPSLGLELPVASEWSYDRLKLSPCRYSGSSKTDDLTIAAHSYKYHFGRIGSLNIGDEVVLTDMDGAAVHYTVAAKEVLEPTAVEDMTDGKYALTLFTCSYDSRNRVTIRCDREV